MMTSRDDLSVLNNHSSNCGIWARASQPFLRFPESTSHETFVVHGFSLSLEVADLNSEVSGVRLRLRDKERFYHELAQLSNAGVTVPAALQSMQVASHGSYRRMLNQLHRAITHGATLGEALQKTPAISSFEAAVVRASERAGQIVRACNYLERYFARLDRLRSALWRRSLYPLFVLHLAVFVIALPRVLLTGGGLQEYLWMTVGFLIALYAALAGICMLAIVAHRAAVKHRVIDRVFGLVPIAGRLRRDLSTAAFCMTLDIQFDAGVNVLESVHRAAAASQSAIFAWAGEKAGSHIRNGEQLGAALAHTRVLPKELWRRVQLAEQTGNLDEELPQLAAEYQAFAESRIDMLAEWGSRLIYVGVMLYLGWQILDLYRGVLQTYSEVLEL
jgi:type II secretory pathway component PulF